MRRLALQLLEFLGDSKYDIVEFLLSNDFLKLCSDESSTIRIQLINTIGNILDKNKTNELIINVWIKITMNLANDPDNAVQKTALQSFKLNIINNIVAYKAVLTKEQLFPWHLFRTILTSTECPNFRVCLESWIRLELLT